MKYRLLFILLILSTQSVGAVILSGHPRVWLNSTIVARLQADVTANTADWVELKAWCDDNLAVNNGGAYYGDGVVWHGTRWQEAALSYGLCFQATGNQTYGNEGVVYMEAMLDDDVDGGSVGDGLGGDDSILTDSGYNSRSIGVGVAIARDWLDGATALTPTLIEHAVTRMKAWRNLILTDAGINAEDLVADNYYYGHFAMVYTSAFSFYGDTGYDTYWLTDAEDMWESEISPYIEGGFYDSGNFPKGWNYAPLSNQFLLNYFEARDTATDEAAPWAATTLHTKLTKLHLHFLYPSRSQFSDNGMWSADVKGDPRSTLARMLIAKTPISSEHKSALKWYIDNKLVNINEPSAWQKFLYKISDITAAIPTAPIMDGLSYYLPIGHLNARSSTWSNTDASFIEFYGYTDYNLSDTVANRSTQGDFNLGDMRFASRGISLIADGDKQQYYGRYQNQLLVTGSHTYAPEQEHRIHGKSGVTGYPEVSMTHGGSDGVYYYGKIVNIQNAYDGFYYTNAPSLAHYDRSMLAIWPDTVIVYDNATATSTANDVSVRWWFPRLPTTNGNVITTTDASADLKLTVLGVAGVFNSTPGTSQELSVADGSNAYRAGDYYNDFVTTGTPINNQMFTVMQATDNAVSPPAVVEIFGAGGRGALVGSTAAMFTDSQTGADISTLTYTTDATTHYVADLPINTSIAVTRAGTPVSGSPFYSGAAGIIEFAAATGSANYSVVAGGAVQTRKPSPWKFVTN